MGGTISSADCLRKTGEIEMHVVDDQCVVYDAGVDRIHYLNPAAALVLEFCDGNRPAGEIAALLQEAYALPAAPLDEVSRCLCNLKEMGIIC
jgi:hypothetical protein